MNQNLILLTVAVFSLCVNRTHAAEWPSFDRLNSPIIKIQPPLKKLPPDERSPLVKLLSSAPSGLSTRASFAECSPEAFEKIIFDIKNGKAPAVQLQKSFNECDAHLRRLPAPKLIKLLKFAAVSYEVNRHRNIREISIGLGNKITRKALLALKPGRRPLVIVQCGLLCDVYDLPSKILLMHLYDGTPFNVLVLGSVAGEEYVKSEGLSFGGFEEALQISNILNIVSNPNEPLSKLIDGVHLVGASLGGQGVLYSALFSSYQQTAPIQSVIAFCPVVNFKESVVNLSRGSSFAQNLGERARVLLGQALKGVQDPTIKSLYRKGLSHFTALIEELGFRKYSAKTNWLPEPLNYYNVTTREDFWALGEFSKFGPKIKVPTFVWASRDDDIVLSKQNTEKLKGPSIKTLLSRNGLHCMASSYYGWDMATSLMRAQILSETGAFYQSRQSAEIEFPAKIELTEGETYFAHEWSAEKKSLELTLKIWSPELRAGNTRCGKWDPYYAFEGCFRRRTIEIPYSKFVGSDLFIPKSGAEEDSLTRWANANLTIHVASGEVMHHTKKAPKFIRWTNY